MSELTAEQMKEKIEMVKRDLDRLRMQGGNDRQMSVLLEYQNYLEDELKFIQNENRSNQST